eukprot:scaffold47920_cov21-Tisochrysis_lutea.AAC.2
MATVCGLDVYCVVTSINANLKLAEKAVDAAARAFQGPFIPQGPIKALTPADTAFASRGGRPSRPDSQLVTVASVSRAWNAGAVLRLDGCSVARWVNDCSPGSKIALQAVLRLDGCSVAGWLNNCSTGSALQAQ